MFGSILILKLLAFLPSICVLGVTGVGFKTVSKAFIK